MALELVKAVVAENVGLVRKLLADSRTDISEADNSGASAFMLACVNGNSEIAEMLFSHPEFDPNVVDHQGFTALMLAVKFKRYDFIALLLTRDDINVNALNARGYSALMYLPDYSSPEGGFVDLNILGLMLSDPRVDSELVDSSGRTMLSRLKYRLKCISANPDYFNTKKMILARPVPELCFINAISSKNSLSKIEQIFAAHYVNTMGPIFLVSLLNYYFMNLYCEEPKNEAPVFLESGEIENLAEIIKFIIEMSDVFDIHDALSYLVMLSFNSVDIENYPVEVHKIFLQVLANVNPEEVYKHKVLDEKEGDMYLDDSEQFFSDLFIEYFEKLKDDGVDSLNYEKKIYLMRAVLKNFDVLCSEKRIRPQEFDYDAQHNGVDILKSSINKVLKLYLVHLNDGIITPSKQQKIEAMTEFGRNISAVRDPRELVERYLEIKDIISTRRTPVFFDLIRLKFSSEGEDLFKPIDELIEFYSKYLPEVFIDYSSDNEYKQDGGLLNP